MYRLHFSTKAMKSKGKKDALSEKVLFKILVKL